MIVAPTDFERLFVARTHERPIVASNTDVDIGSRIGGPPPETLPPRTCPRCGRAMVYWLTVDPEMLRLRAASDDRAISLLYCQDFACRWDARFPVDPSPLAVVGHAPARRAVQAHPGITPFEGRALVLGTMEPNTPTDMSKLGGKPGYVQTGEVGGVYEEQGFEFLAQFHDGYGTKHNGALRGYKAAFSHGTVYVFARVDGARFSSFVAFYECS
jgi:hypothetical protein